MKVGIIALLVLAAAGLGLFPIGSAEATMYVDSEERRSGSFVLMAFVAGALGILSALMGRRSIAIEPEMESSSVIVPQIKQESNIVQRIVAA
jgi:fucose permease